MALSLKVSAISSSWAEELKRARQNLIEIGEAFADKFERSVEDVLDGIVNDDASVNDESTNNRMSNNEEKKSYQKGRIRDYAVEASTKRPRNTESSESNSAKGPISKRKKIIAATGAPNFDEEKEEEEGEVSKTTAAGVSDNLTTGVLSKSEKYPNFKNKHKKTVRSPPTLQSVVELEIDSDLARVKKATYAKSKEGATSLKRRHHSVFVPSSRTLGDKSSKNKRLQNYVLNTTVFDYDTEEESRKLLSHNRRRHQSRRGLHKGERFNERNGYDSEEEYADLLQRPEGASTDTQRKTSFYRSLGKISSKLSTDGRIVVLENATYMDDTNNLNIPLPKRWLFARRVADQLLCLNGDSDEYMEDEQYVSIDMVIRNMQNRTENSSIGNVEQLLQKGIDFLYNCYGESLQNEHDADVWCSKFQALLVSSVLAHGRNCWSSVLVFREEELRLQKLCNDGLRNIVLKSMVPPFSQMFLSWQSRVNSYNIFLKNVIYSEMVCTFLKSRTENNRFAEIPSLLQSFHVGYLIEKELNELLISLLSSVAYQFPEGSSSLSLRILDLILNFNDSSNIDKYLTTLVCSTLERMLAALEWKKLILAKFISIWKASDPQTTQYHSEVMDAARTVFLDIFLLWLGSLKCFINCSSLYTRLIPVLSKSSAYSAEMSNANSELNLLFSLMNSFSSAQSEMQQLNLSNSHDLYPIVHCRIWDVFGSIVLNSHGMEDLFEAMKKATHRYKTNWQSVLWTLQPLQSPQSLKFAEFSHSCVLHLVFKMESIWSCLAFITKYQRQRLQVSRCSNHWALVHLMCKTCLQMIVGSTSNIVGKNGDNVVSVPIVTKLFLRNLQRLAAMVLYWDAGNDAFAYFIEFVTVFGGHLNSSLSPDSNILKVENVNPTGDFLTLQQSIKSTLQKLGEKEDSVGNLDSHLGLLKFTSRSSLLVAEHLYREIESKRNKAGMSWHHARCSLHRYLLLVVVLTFATFRLPHPLSALCDSLLVPPRRNRSSSQKQEHENLWELFANSGKDVAAESSTTKFMTSCIESMRTSFKLLLHNLTSTADVATGNHSVTPAFIGRVEKHVNACKDKILQVFVRKPHFASGSLLCLLVKELEGCLGMNFVRTRLGLGSTLVDSLISIPLEAIQDQNATIAVDLAFSAEDRQRSCLMFLASLLVFNPFPIPTTRTSSFPLHYQPGEDRDWSAKLHTDDLLSFAPFIDLVTLVQTICTNCVVDHGKLTDEVEVLLFSSLSTCIVVVNHFEHCYWPVHYQQQQTQQSASAEGIGAQLQLVRPFPSQIIQTSLQLLQSFIQLCVNEKSKPKFVHTELVSFAVFFIASIVRMMHKFVEKLWEEDTTSFGLMELVLGELRKISSFLALPIFRQLHSSLKILIISQLRKCRESQDSFDACVRQSSSKTNRSQSGDSFLYPTNLEVLQESKGYVFATCTAKLIVPVSEIVSSIMFISWSLTSRNAVDSTTSHSSTPVFSGLEFWKSWYESFNLSLLAGEEMCVGFWQKAMLWSQITKHLTSLHQQYVSLATNSDSTTRQQMAAMLASYRQHFIVHLHDVLLLVLALEAMDAAKSVTVLGFGSLQTVERIIDSFVCLDIISIDTILVNDAPVKSFRLHASCFPQYSSGNYGLASLERMSVCVFVGMANKYLVPQASASTQLANYAPGKLVVLEEVIDQLLVARQTSSFVLPSNYVDQLIQNVYFRVLQFLTICRFQASEESLADIENCIFTIHRPLVTMLYLAEIKCFPSDMRVSMTTIVRYFSDFVHPHVKALIEVIRDVHQNFFAKNRGSTTAAHTTLITQLDASFQRLLALLPQWVVLILVVPFATQCTKWSVLLELLLVTYHPRLKLQQYREVLMVAWQKEIKNRIDPTRMPLSVVSERLVAYPTIGNSALLATAAAQFMGFVFVPQCPLWFQAMFSLEKSLYPDAADYALERLSEPQVNEVIGLVIRDCHRLFSSIG
jgi:hypothetical protein